MENKCRTEKSRKPKFKSKACSLKALLRFTDPWKDWSRKEKETSETKLGMEKRIEQHLCWALKRKSSFANVHQYLDGKMNFWENTEIGNWNFTMF